jgi:hypothetical protein
MREKINVYKILVRRHEEKGTPQRFSVGGKKVLGRGHMEATSHD